MKFSVIGIGKIKEKWMKAGIAEYTKRLSGMGRVEFIEQGEERVPDNPSPADITKAMDREVEKLLKYVPEGACVILLDTRGKEMSSEDFSHWMEKKMVTGSSHFCFLIGGPYGNSDLLRKRAQLRFCLGQITLTHQMARLILTEQIYRAMKIMRHEPYHL